MAEKTIERFTVIDDPCTCEPGHPCTCEPSREKKENVKLRAALVKIQTMVNAGNISEAELLRIATEAIGGSERINSRGQKEWSPKNKLAQSGNVKS